jgi:hypothetical protein
VKKTVFQVEKRKNHRETSWMLAGFTLKKNVKKLSGNLSAQNFDFFVKRVYSIGNNFKINIVK